MFVWNWKNMAFKENLEVKFWLLTVWGYVAAGTTERKPT